MLLPASQVIQDKTATNGQVATYDSSLGLYTPQTTIAMTTQTWGTVWAGPADGGTAAVPTFRNLTLSDLPTIGKRHMVHQAGTTTGITVITFGMVATGAPTYSNADAADGQWRRFTSVGGTTPSIGFSASFYPDWLPDFTFRVKTDSTLPSDCTALGVGDGNFGTVDTGVFDDAAVVCVRYAPYAAVNDNTAFWRIVSNDQAGAATVVVTTMAIAVSTVYEFRFQWVSLTSVKIYSRTGNGSAWALLGTVTATLPPTVTAIFPFVVVQEAGATPRGISFNLIDGYLN